MTLTARLWSLLTTRLLDGATHGTTDGYLVVDASTEGRDLADTLSLPAYRDPVDELQSLEDKRGKVYLWQCADDAKADSLLRQFDEAGASAFDALHIVVADETELRELSKADLEPYLGGLE
jgi:hypothetical protein